MKCLSCGGALVWFAFAAFQSAPAQRVAPIRVVPHDEMSRTPWLREAPATPQPATSQGTPTVQPEATYYANVPQQPGPTAPSLPGKLSYNSCTIAGPYIAMTFDDGPNPQLTPKLLDMLKERGIKATFFLVGRNVEEYPDIVRRMSAEGHEVANHSWSHPALTRLGGESFRKQIENTNDAIVRATGKRPLLMRPPYGATSSILNRRLAEEFGLKVILWSVDPLDWKYRNSNRVYSYIIQNTQPGSIILAHDIHATTVAAMPATLDSLLGKGYKFVTVSELIAMEVRPQLVKKESSTPAVPVSQ